MIRITEKNISRNFQTRILTRVILLIIAVIVITGIVSYTVAVQIEKNSSVQLYGATNTVNDDVRTVSRMEVVRPVIVRSVFLGGGIGIIIAAVVMFFYLHRLAHIVYCLERQIEEIIKGNNNLKFHFGRKIEFKELSDIINSLQDKLKEEKLSKVENA